MSPILCNGTKEKQLYGRVIAGLNLFFLVKVGRPCMDVPMLAANRTMTTSLASSSLEWLVVF